MASCVIVGYKYQLLFLLPILPFAKLWPKIGYCIWILTFYSSFCPINMSFLVTLFDCKLYVFKNSSNWLAILNETFSVIFKHCEKSQLSITYFNLFFSVNRDVFCRDIKSKDWTHQNLLPTTQFALKTRCKDFYDLQVFAN